jgi:16S rRNA (cytosine967-C5)-methyltransferase
MRIAHSHLKTAASLVSTYPKGKPLVHHLKSYFSAHKKMGSRDRKFVSRCVYAYFRCFAVLDILPQLEDKIIASLFLTQDAPDSFLDALNPEWNLLTHLDIQEKCKILGAVKSTFFNFLPLLSDAIDPNAISASLLKQPDLFLRIRPGAREKVLKKLDDANIEYEVFENTIRLQNSTNLDSVISMDKEVVVQDLSTQKAFDQLPKHLFHPENISVWDCCAASGGKSILIADILNKKLNITATDIRKNMLSNLTERMQRAKLNLHRFFVADLTLSSGMTSTDSFDLIIADVPCTGSGTWARTPEQHFSFNENECLDFQQKQKKIIDTVIPHLKNGGFLVYSTCSVFKAENETQVSYFSSTYGLELISETYYDGTAQNSDSLFSAVLRKTKG